MRELFDGFCSDFNSVFDRKHIASMMIHGSPEDYQMRLFIVYAMNNQYHIIPKYRRKVEGNKKFIEFDGVWLKTLDWTKKSKEREKSFVFQAFIESKSMMRTKKVQWYPDTYGSGAETYNTKKSNLRSELQERFELFPDINEIFVIIFGMDIIDENDREYANNMDICNSDRFIQGYFSLDVDVVNMYKREKGKKRQKEAKTTLFSLVDKNNNIVRNGKDLPLDLKMREIFKENVAYSVDKSFIVSFSATLWRFVRKNNKTS